MSNIIKSVINTLDKFSMKNGGRLFKIQRSFGNAGLSIFVLAEGLFLNDVEVVTISFRKSDGSFLVSNNESIA